MLAGIKLPAFMSAAGGSISGMGSNLGAMVEGTASLARHLSHRASSLGTLPEEQQAAGAGAAAAGAPGASPAGMADAVPSRTSLLVRRLSAAAASLTRAGSGVDRASVGDGASLSKAGSTAAALLAGARVSLGQQQQLSVSLQDAALATMQSGDLDQGHGGPAASTERSGSRHASNDSDAGSIGAMSDIPITPGGVATPGGKGADAGLLGSGLLTPQLSRKATVLVDADFEGLAGEDQGEGRSGLIGTEVQL
jgi:hypothetical protein